MKLSMEEWSYKDTFRYRPEKIQPAPFTLTLMLVSKAYQ